jgi:septum formation protein
VKFQFFHLLPVWKVLMTLKNGIILASGSPRRQALLKALGLAFTVAVSDVDESPRPGERPDHLAQRLSLLKASAIRNKEKDDVLIIAADTVVAVDGAVLGKPASEGEAVAMLERMRGRRHAVYSGLTLLGAGDGEAWSRTIETPVIMRDYARSEIEAYVKSGDPMDKAGAYAIQHQGFCPVACLESCYANVMGLPMCHLTRALRQRGHDTPIHPLNACPFAVENDGCPWAGCILDGGTPRLEVALAGLTIQQVADDDGSCRSGAI